jgi:hypothetical protein
VYLFGFSTSWLRHICTVFILHVNLNYVHTYFNWNVALHVFSLFARVIWVFLDYLMSLYPSRWVKFGMLPEGNGDVHSWPRLVHTDPCLLSRHLFCDRWLRCLIVALVRSIEYSVSLFGRRQVDRHVAVCSMWGEYCLFPYTCNTYS